MGHPGPSVALYCLPNRLLLLAVVATPTHSLNNATATTTLPPGFTQHAQFTGIGGLLTTLVGPGPTPGSERLYASHIYGGIALDVVAVDPLTGDAAVFTTRGMPAPVEYGAWGMTVGPDGQVYVGTLPTAHILRVDWKTKKLVDCGQPSKTEAYIWQLAVGTDKKIYGCTYPNAKLVRLCQQQGTC